MTIQMKATEQYFPVVLLIVRCKVVLTFKFEDKILKCGYSNETTEQFFPVLLLSML